MQAYNYVLSLHQRDVLRADPAGRKRPAEWVHKKQAEASKKLDLLLPSAEKTTLDLLCGANGGEQWDARPKAKLPKPRLGIELPPLM